MKHLCILRSASALLQGRKGEAGELGSKGSAGGLV